MLMGKTDISWKWIRLSWVQNPPDLPNGDLGWWNPLTHGPTDANVLSLPMDIPLHPWISIKSID